MLSRVVDLVFEVIPAERAFLLLRDAADQALTARVLRNRDGTAPQQATLSRTVINKVMREGSPCSRPMRSTTPGSTLRAAFRR